MKIAAIRYRLLAFIADLIINSVMVFLILVLTSSDFLINLLFGEATVINLFILYKLIQVAILVAAYLVVYTVIIPLYTRGQTLGYYIFKIRIVKEDNKEVDFVSLFIREIIGRLALDITTFGMSFIISFILMVYRADNCGIQDILGRTKVVDA
jgi:uncharacterized RDD family membrane protein YckC